VKKRNVFAFPLLRGARAARHQRISELQCSESNFLFEVDYAETNETLKSDLCRDMAEVEEDTEEEVGSEDCRVTDSAVAGAFEGSVARHVDVVVDGRNTAAWKKEELIQNRP